MLGPQEAMGCFNSLSLSEYSGTFPAFVTMVIIGLIEFQFAVS